MKFPIYDFDEEITQGLIMSVKVKKKLLLTWVKVPGAVGEDELRTAVKTFCYFCHEDFQLKESVKENRNEHIYMGMLRPIPLEDKSHKQ